MVEWTGLPRRKAEGWQNGNAPVLKTGGRKPLQVRVLHPPLSDGVEKNRKGCKPLVSSNPLPTAKFIFMTFSEYQKLTAKTALYKKVPVLKKIGTNIYPVLGLAGEAGEVAEKVKKMLRNDNGIITTEFKNDLTKELGDVLWYVSQTASEFKIDLDKIASGNIEKLLSRKKRGALHSQGDNR